MDTKPSPREFNQKDREFMSMLNESQKRQFVATQAMACGCHGVGKVSKFFCINQKTVYAGIKNTYETGRKIKDDYYQRLSNQVVFRQDLPKWNYLIKSS